MNKGRRKFFQALCAAPVLLPPIVAAKVKAEMTKDEKLKDLKYDPKTGHLVADDKSVKRVVLPGNEPNPPIERTAFVAYGGEISFDSRSNPLDPDSE